MAVVIETSIGDITVDLFIEDRPRCCLNFLKLCKLKYYNFSLFHSVQRNLVAQAGDPTETGRGGHSIYNRGLDVVHMIKMLLKPDKKMNINQLLYGDQAAYFDAEVKPRLKHQKFGTISMVNNGSNMHGSQFFITLGENIDYLDKQMHTVFGVVGEGFDIVKKFNDVFVDKENRPFKDIRIFHTVVLDDPFDDPEGLDKHIPDLSPEPTQTQLESIMIGVDEEINDDEGLTREQIEEKHQEKEARGNAQILEMVGDLPSMDVRPPDNVLFVCKLNPVTTSEDLEIIFSRFGPIECCEVIKDRKTNQSLQYAFIEFLNVKDCESAYFKMDNVLIDDRRIHVDFSQSVSKIQWNRKGKEQNNKKNERDAQDPEKPQFRIKDPDMRTDPKYDFVFDEGSEDEAEGSGKKEESRHKHKYKKEKKNKKSRHSSSDSNTSSHSHHKKKKKSHEKDKKKSEERSSHGRSRDEKSRHYRSRDDRSPDERSRDEKSRNHRSREEKPRDHRSRDDRSRDAGRSNREERRSRSRSGGRDRHKDRDSRDKRKRSESSDRHKRDRHRDQSRDRRHR